MPTPQADEKESEFISRCIPIILDEGTAEDEKQAAAICYSMWRKEKNQKSVPSYHKVITDAPDLRGKNEHSCGNCKYFQNCPPRPSQFMSRE